MHKVIDKMTAKLLYYIVQVAEPFDAVEICKVIILDVKSFILNT
jgi:hypothetical protein